MTTTELSDQFDVLYNSITSNQAPGLNEYEKSVFLTKAQEEIVKNYLSPKGNVRQEGFDDSPKRQVDFSSIMESSSLQSTSNANRFDPRSECYLLPSNMFIVLNEQLSTPDRLYTVVPISYDEYNRLMSKPYKYPPKNQAWRLITRNEQISASSDVVTQNYVSGEQTYSLRIVSSYGKPVRFILKTVDSDTADFKTYGNYPILTETSSLVTITCGIAAGSPSSNYWSLFLVNSASYSTRVPDRPNLEPYIGKFTADTSDSSFPSMTVPSTVGLTLYDITNPGGSTNATVSISEIIGKFSSVPEYRMRYVRRPAPIILADLSGFGDLSIQGESSPQTSELPEELHAEILQRAVELAKVAWNGEPNTVIQAGQRSE